MPRVVHFEIHADDPERAVRFYEAVFGWKVQKWEGPMDYWLITTGEPDERGIDGAILRRNRPVTGEGVTAFVCTVGVGDLDATLAAVEKAGGSIAMPKDRIPGVGMLASVHDTEGNLFSILQPDPGSMAGGPGP